MKTEWIAVDWGTTNLRAWVVSHAGLIIDQAGSDHGMGRLTPDQFEPALLDLIATFLPNDKITPIVCCGMVGARQGWIEAPYAFVPCAPSNAAILVCPKAIDPRIKIHILPGVAQTAPPDVMRGEETQIGGYLAGNPDFEGVICLPGTHTKWVHISAGEIVSFRSFMTGEIFALLSCHSVLRHSLTTESWDDKAFTAAVIDAKLAPQNLSSSLFSLRAGVLLNGLPRATATAQLSGWLIGLELAGSRPYWLGQEVVVIGPDKLGKRYMSALEALGVAPKFELGDTLALAGLTTAFSKLKEDDL